MPSGIERNTTIGMREIRPYTFRGPAELLEDFYREAERILMERGVR